MAFQVAFQVAFVVPSGRRLYGLADCTLCLQLAGGLLAVALPVFWLADCWLSLCLWPGWRTGSGCRSACCCLEDGMARGLGDWRTAGELLAGALPVTGWRPR